MSLSRLSLLGLLGLFIAAPALAKEPSETEAPRKRKPVVFSLDASLDVMRESNVFHVARRRLPGFATETAQYQRFHGMEGPDDVGALLSMQLGWRWRRSSHRAIELRFRAQRESFVDNEIADGSGFRITGIFEPSRHDRLRLDAGWAPERFRKNASYEAFPGISVYGRADETRASASLAYERELSKRWTATAGCSWRKRDFASPFDFRDEERIGWSAGVAFEPVKRLALSLEAGRRRGSTGLEPAGTYAKDRSYEDDVVSLGVGVKLPRKWRIEESTSFRSRDFTTSAIEDATRHGRTDRRWSTSLAALKRIGDHWSLRMGVSRLDRHSGRVVPGVSAHALGYDDTAAWMGFGWSR